MSDEAWLIGRKVDASKKISTATEILVFDFELFMGGRRQFVIGCKPAAFSVGNAKAEEIKKELRVICASQA